MPSPFRTYLDALRHFPFAVLQQPQHYFRRPGRDFTRRRSLYLERVVWLNITLLKTTLSVELDQFFDWLGTGEYSVTKSALVCYDLLNQLVTALQFHTRNTAEAVVAQRSIGQIPQDVLMVYDRGFASHIIPFLHQHFGSNCIVRQPLGRSHTVKAIVLSGKNQQIVKEPLQIRAKKVLTEQGIYLEPNPTITYRLIRIRLPNGQTEVLLTTLLDKKKFHWPHFGEIYRKRWGIESCFFVIKSFLQLFNFSAYTVNNCWQDVYSHFILYNLQTVLHQPLQKNIRKINTDRQYDYKPNRNISAGLLKRFMVKFCLRPIEELQAYLSDYYHEILQTLEAERPGKNKERR